jgi:drug/metabolite transporter (DMT)-like permease
MTAVLFAALLHASWNAIVKSGTDKFLETIFVACGAALVSAVVLFFVPLPARESWPYLGCSAGIHLASFALLAAAYRSGDLSYTYPIMRGTAPLLTALVAGYFVAERLSPGGWAGVIFISGGILLLTANQWRSGHFHLAPTLYAFANAAVICLYTVVDGVGTRLSGSSFGYVSTMLAIDGIILVAFVSLRYRSKAIAQLKSRWHITVGGGVCTWASYAIALWAMTRAPVAMVAALRETSVVFAAIIAALILKEKFSNVRYAAAMLVCAGAVALKVF